MIYEIAYADNDKLRHLFCKTNTVMVKSFLQGHMGRAWVDDPANPSCAKIMIGDFCCFAGDASAKAAVDIIAHIPPGFDSKWMFLEIPDAAWEALALSRIGSFCTAATRYQMQIDAVFSKEQLKRHISSLPAGYTLHEIDAAYYEICMRNPELMDLCANFSSAADYIARGMGYCVLFQGALVAGASAYAVYDDGIEVEIDTLADHRRKGLALACASGLILKCLASGQYPYWDAANERSLMLAKKLGYQVNREYQSYILDAERYRAGDTIKN